MKRLLGAVAGFLIVGTVLAQANTSAALAPNVQWGQKVLSSITADTSQFWFRTTVVQPRSYCVETAQPETGQFADKPSGQADTFLTVYQSDGTTVIATNDEATVNEPKAEDASRVCWRANGNTRNFVKLTSFLGVPAQNIELRFVETTLFCPWFFVAGDYNAFTLIRNNSNTTLNNVVVTYYSASGAVAGNTAVSVPADGSLVLNARDFVNPTTVPNGTIVIAHDGSPQQLSGSTTTLSGTTGLSFDAQFTQRLPW